MKYEIKEYEIFENPIDTVNIIGCKTIEIRFGHKFAPGNKKTYKISKRYISIGLDDKIYESDNTDEPGILCEEVE
jgi:hypothetical protein